MKKSLIFIFLYLFSCSSEIKQNYILKTVQKTKTVKQNSKLPIFHYSNRKKRRRALVHLVKKYDSKVAIVDNNKNSPSINMDENNVFILLEGLKTKDEDLKEKSLDILTELHIASIPFLIKALEINGFKEESALILGNLGEKAKSAIPALIKLSKNINYSIRLAGFLALIEIDPLNENVIKTLKRGLNDKNMEIRLFCAAILGEQKKHANSVLNSILSILKNGSNEEKSVSAYLLGEMGKTAEKAGYELTKSTENKDFGVKFNSIIALGKIQYKSGLSRLFLTRLSKNREHLIRKAAKKARKIIWK
jgi:hypothetical protein